jgi:hypothetical protein
MTLSEWGTVGQLAKDVTSTSILLLIVWGYFTGKIPTRAEVARVDTENERLLKQHDAAREELKQNNATIERLTDAVTALKLTLEARIRR